MARITYLGLVDELQPLTFGEPGKRTFNITVSSTRGSGVVWLEKEQLYNIADSLGTALARTDSIPEPDYDDDADIPPDFDGGDLVDHTEFKAWQIALQYDERRRIFIFAAAGPDPAIDPEQQRDEPDAVMLQFAFSHRQGIELAMQGIQIVAAGRPICTYCGVPINRNEPHKCQRRNGHNPEAAIETLDHRDDNEEDKE